MTDDEILENLDLNYTEIEDGKIIFCDFRKLKVNSSFMDLGEIISHYMFISSDGKVYVNSILPGSYYFVKVFRILLKETPEKLKGYVEYKKQKYTGIKKYSDLSKVHEPGELAEAFTMLTIPLELKRREAEKGQTKNF